MNFRDPEQDFFESSRMSFGEHLDELRKVLIKSLVAIVIGCIIASVFANQVIDTLNRPLVKAINQYNLTAAREEMEADIGYIPPDLIPWFEQDGYVPQKFRIDLDELITELKQEIPDLGEKITVRTDLFAKQDFDPDRLTALATSLVNKVPGDEVEKAHIEAIWKRLTPPQQELAKSIADKSSIEESDMQQFSVLFNAVAESDLHNDPAFESWLSESGGGFLKNLFSSPGPRPMAKIKKRIDESGDNSLARGLNRAIIGKTFADQMPPVKRNLREMTFWKKTSFRPQSLAATDGFLIWLKAVIISGLIISLPFVMYFIWSFVAAGLYPHEQKYVHIFLPISLALFLGGVLLAFFFVFQPVLGFLFSFNKSMGIAPEMRINEWLSFVLFLPLGFGIAFQLPLVMLFVNRIGMISVEDYIEKWRIAVMAISVLSMLLTPADPISMLLMGVPLTGLYFLGIAMCKWMPRPNPNPFEDSAQPAV